MFRKAMKCLSTLLHFAAEIGNEVTVKLLLKKGIDVNVQDKRGRTAIMLAIKNQHYKTVSLILKFNPNLQLEDESGNNAVTLMLEADYDPLNFTNIMTIFGINENEKLGKLYIEWQSNVGHYNSKAICNAIVFNNAELLRLLINNGYPVNCQMPRSKRTPLHVAFENRCLQSAMVLLEHRADVNINCQRQGRIPVSYYFLRDCQCTDSDSELEVLKIVFDRATTLTTLDQRGEMQISQLLRHGKKRVIEALLRSNAVDWTAKDRMNRTPLHYLATNENLLKEQHLFKLLRGKELKIDLVDDVGESVLFKAAMNAMSGLVQLLFDRNAIVRESDKLNLLLIVYRRISGIDKEETNNNYYRCAELLLQHVVDPQREFQVWRCGWCRSESLNAKPCEYCSVLDRFEGFQRTTRVTPKRTILDMTWDNEDRTRTKLILAHLAIIEARGTKIIDPIQTKINSHPWLTHQFSLCKRQLSLLMKTDISNCTNLFDFMFASEDKLVLYLRNQKFFSSLKRLDKNVISKSIYSNVLWDRLRKSLQIVEAKRNAASIVCEGTGLSYQAHHLIVDKIIEYFWSDKALYTFSKV